MQDVDVSLLTLNAPTNETRTAACGPGSSRGEHIHLHAWIDPLCPDGKMVWNEAHQNLALPRHVSVSLHLFPLPFHLLSYEVLCTFHRLPTTTPEAKQARLHFVNNVMNNIGKFSNEALNHNTLRDMHLALVDLYTHAGQGASQTAQLLSASIGAASNKARLQAKLASALGVFESPQFFVQRDPCLSQTTKSHLTAAPLPLSVFTLHAAVDHVSNLPPA